MIIFFSFFILGLLQIDDLNKELDKIEDKQNELYDLLENKIYTRDVFIHVFYFKNTSKIMRFSSFLYSILLIMVFNALFLTSTNIQNNFQFQYKNQDNKYISNYQSQIDDLNKELDKIEDKQNELYVLYIIALPHV